MSKPSLPSVACTRDRSSCLPAADRVAPTVGSVSCHGSLRARGTGVRIAPVRPARRYRAPKREERDLSASCRLRARRRTAAAMRSSVAVSATRTCCAPGGAVEVAGRRRGCRARPASSTVVPAVLARGSPRGRARPRSGRRGSPAPRARGQQRGAARARSAPAARRRARRRRARRPSPPAPGRAPSCPACLRTSSSRPTSAGSPATNAGAVAGEVGPLRQRVDREQPSCEPPHDPRVEELGTAGARAVPAELDVALVAGHDRAALARPGDDLRRCSTRQHPAGRVPGELSQTSAHAAAGPSAAVRVGRRPASAPASRAPTS